MVGVWVVSQVCFVSWSAPFFAVQQALHTPSKTSDTHQTDCFVISTHAPTVCSRHLRLLGAAAARAHLCGCRCCCRQQQAQP